MHLEANLKKSVEGGGRLIHNTLYIDYDVHVDYVYLCPRFRRQ